MRISSTPPGAVIYLNAVARGETPQRFDLEPGDYALRVEKRGYAPIVKDVALRCGQEVVLTEVLRDNEPPQVDLGDVPESVGPDDGLKLSASAEDNVGAVYMALSVDGHQVLEVNEPSFRHNLDTRALNVGQHLLVVRARDAAGNVGRGSRAFEVVGSTASPGPSRTQAATATMQATATSTATPAPTASATSRPTATATQPAVTPVSVRWGEVTIDTYAYEQALYTDPDKAGHPYPLLHRDRVWAPVPRTYQVLILRNEYLELTFLPELGGRLYQCRYLPTGQVLFYNNRTIKPSHWGPEDQGWWLAVGGIEFCLPVNEHGYLTAEPWDAQVAQHDDGSATVTMSIEERSRRLLAAVAITLRPGEGAFRLRSTLSNPDTSPKSFQYWINAMLSPGSPGAQASLRFYYPASEVIVHSRGDAALPDAHGIMSWPVYEGRDLSRYGNWRDWLGFFAPSLREPYTAVYDEVTRLGMVRVYPPDVVQGNKLFGFGLGFGDTRAYTDDGSQYVEMWSGLSPTFWDDATLGPQASVAWEEMWYPISGCDGVSTATSQATLYATRTGNRVEVVVFSPGERRWTLSVSEGDREVSRQAFTVRPDSPFRAEEASLSGNSALSITVRILDAVGNVVIAYVL